MSNQSFKNSIKRKKFVCTSEEGIILQLEYNADVTSPFLSKHFFSNSFMKVDNSFYEAELKSVKMFAISLPVSER